MSVVLVALALLSSSLSSPVAPDPGMWTFDNLPIEHLKQRYGFEPTPAWIDHARLSSVRVSSGGSGSFVSPTGLVMTNHHVALEYINALSTANEDLVKNGFHARNRGEERRCPNAELRQLRMIKDVTAQVDAAAKGIEDSAAAATARQAAMDKISAAEKAAGSHDAVEIVTLYGGSRYHAYGYKVYSDVRLVFAPEMRAAYYGGDWDNFTYPRWCLDVSFLRAYEDGKPADTSAHYFRWSAKGPSKDELVFVSGNPGSTARLWPMARLRHERDVYNPAVLTLLKRREEALARYAARGDTERIKVLDDLFGVRNSLKAYGGHQQGLVSGSLWADKEAEEAAFVLAAKGDPEVAEALATFERTRKLRDGAFVPLIFLRLEGDLGTLARQLVQISTFPEERRTGDALAALVARFSADQAFDLEYEKERLAANFDNAVAMLGKEHPYVQRLGGKDAMALAESVVKTTKLKDPVFRRAFVASGGTMVADDLLLDLARIVQSGRAPAAAAWAKAESDEAVAAAKLARARFRIHGANRYPDATFTLRLTFGTCKGYDLGTTKVPWTTTLFGLFGRHASMGGQDPFDLPERWLTAREHVDLSTPYNFVSTTDIIGGNSGSPVFNKDLEIVGLIFDGNIQSLPNRYMYLDEVCRSVSVHSEGIKHALERVYKAYALLAELGAR
ncbi:MAG: S46 family peptidase [Planctomycetota bacterium]|nr:S46 family peptidase [Planctomycetota bacterium]